jgi:drug/metabolite transporter (DMT)-like permease
LFGAVLSFAGVLVVVSSGSLGALLQHGVNLGDAMMLIATLAYAIYSTLLKKWQLRLPPLVLLAKPCKAAVTWASVTPNCAMRASRLPSPEKLRETLVSGQ